MQQCRNELRYRVGREQIEAEGGWRIGVLYSRATALRAPIGEIAAMVIDAHEAMDKLGLGKSRNA